MLAHNEQLTTGFYGNYTIRGLTAHGLQPIQTSSPENTGCYYIGRPLLAPTQWARLWAQMATTLTKIEGHIHSGQGPDHSFRTAYQSKRSTLDAIPTLHIAEIKNFGIGEVLNVLNGPFIGVIQTETGLWIVRDPAGERPVYFTLTENALQFSSRLSSLTANKNELDDTALIQFFSYAFVPSERTLYKKLHKLPPGTMLYYPKPSHPNASTEPRREVLPQPFFAQWYLPGAEFGPVGHVGQYDQYGHIDQYENAFGPAGDTNPAFLSARRNLRSTIEAAVAERYQAWVQQNGSAPPGLFLSGGLDSSLVCSLLSQHVSPHRLPTFSIHFGRRYPGEQHYAQAVAQACGTKHRTFKITRRAYMSAAETMVEALDEPIGDPITIPNYMLAKYASDYTSAIFNGEGGDPLFGGPKNIPMLLSQMYAKSPSVAQYYLRSYKKMYELLPSILHPDRFPLAKIQAAAQAPLEPFFKNRLGGPDPLDEKAVGLLHRLMQINTVLKGGQNILTKVFHTYSAAGLEPFSPLFDRRLMDAAFALPAHWKLHGRTEKFILKAACADLLPAAIVYREKSGMRVPIHHWMQPRLKKYAQRYLSPPVLERQGLFHPQMGARLSNSKQAMGWDGHQGAKIWLIIYFQMWYERVFKGKF